LSKNSIDRSFIDALSTGTIVIPNLQSLSLKGCYSKIEDLISLHKFNETLTLKLAIEVLDDCMVLPLDFVLFARSRFKPIRYPQHLVLSVNPVNPAKLPGLNKEIPSNSLVLDLKDNSKAFIVYSD
jgi:hypothetical protein